MNEGFCFLFDVRTNRECIDAVVSLQCDQPKEGLMNNASQIDEFCKERGFIGWFETSAKENINIDESARFLVTQVNKKARPASLLKILTR